MLDETIKTVFPEIPPNILLRNNTCLLPIMHEIWMKEGISRHEIAQHLGVSKVAVSRNIDQLISYGTVSESSRNTTKSGRTPISLFLTDNLFLSAGIRLGYEYSLISLINSSGREIYYARIEHANLAPPEFCQLIIKSLEHGLSQHPGLAERLTGIGIAISGQSDIETGEIIYSSSFDGYANFCLKELFEQHFKRPVFLINNANLLAIYESRYGKATELKNFLYLTSGYGLGMYLSGKIYTGNNDSAGEVGYMQLDGQNNLNEINPFHRIIPKLQASGLKDVTDLESLVKALEHKDPRATKLMSETFEVFGLAARNLACIFHPEVIFLEPWTARCPQFTLDIVRAAMNNPKVERCKLKTQILPAQYGYDCLSRAATELPISKILTRDI